MSAKYQYIELTKTKNGKNTTYKIFGFSSVLKCKIYVSPRLNISNIKKKLLFIAFGRLINLFQNYKLILRSQKFIILHIDLKYL
jgi:hypothetical protein